MSDPTRALGWWDPSAPERSARDRAFGLSISEPLSPAGKPRGAHIAQDRRCGGVGTGLVLVSLGVIAATVFGLALR